MRRRGYAAPIIVAFCLLIYYIGFAVLLLCVPGMALWARLLLLVIPAAIGGLLIGVTVQRIRELNSGETDDLDKY